nr:tetraspanin-4 isoform X4 [Cavia porcellus]
MAIGFVGCIGALKENKCLLLTFFVLLLLVLLLETTIAVLFFAYTDKIDRYAQEDLKKGLHLYGTPGNVGLTNAWSIIQTDFRCCGVSNYTDWFEVYNATRVPDSCCLEFSDGCGLHAPGTWWKAPCYETVKAWLQENLLAVGVFGLCTALVQVWQVLAPQRRQLWGLRTGWRGRLETEDLRVFWTHVLSSTGTQGQSHHLSLPVLVLMGQAVITFHESCGSRCI